MERENFREKIRLNLIYYREKAGMTKAELARACGVSNPTVTHWEQGRNSVDVDLLFRLSHVLGVSVSALGGLTPDGVSFDEMQLLKKYRELDEAQRAMVDASLDAAHSIKKSDAKRPAS